MEIMHRLQRGIGTSTSIGANIGIGSGTSTGGSTSIGTYTGAGAGAHGMDYCLTVDGLVRFKDMIYVPDSSELKKMMLREFHVKRYLGHPGYQKTLAIVKRYYYWLNL